jgi:hypothetical protein
MWDAGLMCIQQYAEMGDELKAVKPLNKYEMHLNTQSVPRSKHTASGF